MKKLSAASIERLHALYVHENVSRDKICAELGISDAQLTSLTCNRGFRRPPKEPTWDLRRQSLLEALVKERLSAGEMARRLGVTRNAVIGRCRRYGLQLNSSKSLSPEQREQNALRAAARARLAREKDLAVSKPPPMPEPTYALPTPPGVDVASIHIDVAGPGQCRFPLWSHRVKTGLVCGKAVMRGSSWCPDCRGRVFTNYPYVRRARA